MKTSSVCIKLKRKKAKKSLGMKPGLIRQGYRNLKEWMKDRNNIYVGRSGRIFITETGNTNIFHYQASKWKNPYKVDQKLKKSNSIKKIYTLKDSLRLYLLHLFSSNLINDIEELRGKKLGCFCSKHISTNYKKDKIKKGGPLCHAQLLVQLLEKCNYILNKRNKPNRALIVKDPWATLIVSGSKKVEVRTRKTNFIGKEIYIAKAGTKTLIGKVTISKCEELPDNIVYKNKKNYGWFLKNPIKFKKPIPYKHPKGAQIWVKINS